MDLHVCSNDGGGGRRNWPADGCHLHERRDDESLERFVFFSFFSFVFCGSRTRVKSRIWAGTAYSYVPFAAYHRMINEQHQAQRRPPAVDRSMLEDLVSAPEASWASPLDLGC
jgi:hypothetical protein